MFVTQDQFDQLKKRYQDYKDEGFIGLDKGMKNIIESLNEIPGLVTVFCCEGHFDDKHNRTPSGRIKLDVIVSVLDQAALEALYKVHLLVAKEFNSPLCGQVCLHELVWPIQERDWINLSMLYPVACLEHFYFVFSSDKEDQVKRLHINMIENAIQTVKENQNVCNS